MSGPKGTEQSMILKRVLTPQRVCFLEPAGKREVLTKLAALLAPGEDVPDRDELTNAIFKREELMSTGIGLGLAVPHVRLASVRRLAMAVGICVSGIEDYETLDDRPVRLIFMIAAPQGEHADYIRLLAAISSRAKELNGRLLECPDAGTFVRVLTGEDQPAVSDEAALG